MLQFLPPEFTNYAWSSLAFERCNLSYSILLSCHNILIVLLAPILLDQAFGILLLIEPNRPYKEPLKGHSTKFCLQGSIV